MDSIGISTSQNISIRQNLASVGQRLLASIIDSLILGAYFFVISLTVAVLNIPSRALFIILMIPAFLYFPLCEMFMNGQTVGKQTRKIRVVKLDGSAPSLSAYLLRWLLGFVDFGFGAGGLAILLIIFTKRGQRLGDLAAGTVVIQEKSTLAGLKRDLKTMESVGEDYQPEFPQVIKLEDADIKLIKGATRAFRQDGVRKPMENLKPKLEEKMQIDPVKMHELKFLDTLLKDYTYYSLKQAEQA